MQALNTLILTMRPPFLILTPCILALGISCASLTGNTLHFSQIILVLAAGLLAHISVNMLNEYADFSSGLDFNTQKTPFSGGSGALVSQPQLAKLVLWVGVLCLLGCVAIGLYFVSERGWPLIAIGVLGVCIIVTYTGWLNKIYWLCLIAPGLAFGPLMILGTEVALTGQVSSTAALASVIPFCLTNNLLLLNQYPDIEADTKAGRYHLLIRFGMQSGVKTYQMFVVLALLALLVGVVSGLFSTWSLIVSLPLCIAILGMARLSGHISHQERLLSFMGINVGITLSCPVFLALALQA